jgi:hypothetical protein
MLPDLRFAIGAILATSVLAVTALGLFTATRLTHQAKPGPLETSRNLAFDDRSDWNQFYDPESARRFEELARKSDGSAQPAADPPADAAPAASAASEIAATPPTDLPAPAADLDSTEFPSAIQTGDAGRPEAAAAPADEPRETGALPPTSDARTPGRDEEPTPIAPDEPPAAAEQAPPANATETDAPKSDAMKNDAGHGEAAKTEAKIDTKTEAPVPMPPVKPAAAPAKPAAAAAERKAKPVVRSPPAPKPRVAAPTQQLQQGQQYWQQQQNWQQQYAPQQYAPRQPAPRPSQNDSFGQPYPRSNSQFGG